MEVDSMGVGSVEAAFTVADSAAVGAVIAGDGEVVGVAASMEQVCIAAVGAEVSMEAIRDSTAVFIPGITPASILDITAGMVLVIPTTEAWDTDWV